MTIAAPLRLDLLQRELYAVVSAAVAPAQCVWGPDEGVWETYSASGVVSLRVLAGPGPVVRQGARGSIQPRVDSVTITVAAVSVGARVGVVVNDRAHFYDIQAGDTASVVRDAVLASLTGDAQYSGLVTVASGATDIVITPGMHEIWSVRHTSAGLLTVIATESPTDSILVTRVTQEVEIEIQAFSKEREIRGGAHVLLQQVLAALQSISDAYQLRDAGIAIRGKGSPVDLSAVAAGHWESRLATTVTFALHSVWTQPVDQIDTLNISHTFSNPPVTDGQIIM